MHYHCEIWVKNRPEDIEATVARLMGHHEDNGGFWDWYVIGGRWTGSHDSYKAENDILNQGICSICNGTGVRADRFQEDKTWVKSTRGCNSCHGAGITQNYSSVPYSGDILELSKVKDALSVYTLIIAKGRSKEVQHTETRDGKKFVKGAFKGPVKEFLKSKGITDGYLITVDYHC